VGERTVMRRTDMKKATKRFRDTISSIGLSILIRFIRGIDYRRASAWGGRLGRLAYHVVPRYRKPSLENLSRVFGEEETPEELEEIAKTLFEGFFRSAFECVAYGDLSPEDKRGNVRIVGKEKLDEALASGRGVISVSAHLGNFLILMGRLAVEGYHVDLVVKKMNDQRVEDRMQNLRTELGYHSIYMNPRIRSAKASLASLKNNRVLVLLGDQRQRNAGIDVTFFGIPANAAAGPISLSLSTGAPVLPMFMVRNQDSITHTLFIEDPLEMSITGSKENDIQTNVQKYTDVIESYVKRYPAQWAWGHNRWAK
jgi:KDO2-lipid IV(A) lauroyltransferase